jgi:hypothetical protein
MQTPASSLGVGSMAAVVAAFEPRKLHAIVLRNLGQLVRISWLWLLILLPIHTALHWLDWSTSPEAGGPETMVLVILSLAGLIYLPRSHPSRWPGTA